MYSLAFQFYMFYYSFIQALLTAKIPASCTPSLYATPKRWLPMSGAKPDNVLSHERRSGVNWLLLEPIAMRLIMSSWRLFQISPFRRLAQ